MSADSSPIRVGLLMGVGGLGDQSFNDSAYLGLLAAQGQYNLQFSTDTWGMLNQNLATLRKWADAGTDLIIALGYGHGPSITQVASERPEQRFAIVDTARHADGKRAREVCAGIQAGEIAIFDKAYIDYSHLADLSMRGVFWVTRAKDDMKYRVVRSYQTGRVGKILRDELIALVTPSGRRDYPELMRRVVALVEVDGQEVEMVFLTNNLEWSAQSIADLYRCRWQIEVFFKQIKQTLQLADFLGTSANAVRWQVWTALLVYLLLRYVAFLSNWSHSFSRLFTILRASLWQKWDLLSLLRRYGTADGHFRYIASPEQAYLPGMG